MSIRKKTFLLGARFGFTLILLFLFFYLLPIGKGVQSSPPCCSWPTPARPQLSPWVTRPSAPTSTPVPKPSSSTSPSQPTSTPSFPSQPTATPTTISSEPTPTSGLGEPTPTSEQVPTPTPTSQPSGGVGGEGGGGGGGGGGPASPCTPPKAPKVPSLLSATSVSGREVKLTWAKVDRATHYAIAYGLSSHNYIFGNPNVGNTNSYTVGGLEGGKTYFFVVSAVIGGDCPVASPYSNELSSKPSGILGVKTVSLAPELVAEGEKPEDQLGGGVSTQAGEVAGISKGVCPFWWIVLVGQTVLLSGFYGFSLKKKNLPKRWWLVAPALVAVAYFIDRYAHTHWYIPSRMCPWEIWLGILLAGAETVFFRKIRKTS